MESTNLFITSKDKPAKIIAGKYPAHVSKLTKRKFGDSEVFDIEFMIAKDVEKLGEEFKNMVGRKFRLGRKASIWLNYNVDKTERWKNRYYKEAMMDIFGVQFPVEMGEDGEPKIKIMKISEEDILGSPVIVTIDLEADKNKPEKKYFKVIKLDKWENGSKIDIKMEEAKEQAESGELPW